MVLQALLAFMVSLVFTTQAVQTPRTFAVTSASRAVQPGEVVLLTITLAAQADFLRGRAFNRDLRPFRINDLTWRMLVGIDLDVPAGVYTVTLGATTAGKTIDGTYRLTVKTRAFPTRQLTVDPAFVDPPADVQPRIAEEAKLLESLWTKSADTRYWAGPFVRPVTEAANSAFGTRSVFNGQARSPHGGADFMSPAGTPIKAPNAGRIVLARDIYYSGNTVVIDHGFGVFSTLAHMSEMRVHEGDKVAAGDVVGLVGATGRVTGAHLHWAVRVAGARVDPLSLLAVLGGG